MTASRVLVTIVVICVLCHSIKISLNFAELVISFQGKDIYDSLNNNTIFNNLSILSNFLIIINSSANFFVYICKDPKFLICLNHCISSSLESSSSDMDSRAISRRNTWASANSSCRHNNR